ncbi:FAD-dependent monooxygenase [Parvibaculum sp.]|uniref:FAD-dependent monooxygenase n=1 Tax=Parvibaculum sp. TaxID=2024848 RepID=UPI001B1C1EE1|nr:FAD-dependent monooxygenase [Parvibaculum sp.]MBO6677408.1 FAD-dependent monooxygenase [Parvibaculum sp.]MBO6684525.1 FAD-dependent monooxygenase [Parvibaculum sp.]MBO6903914.1 FAD-dependent monooxygenase [Parvibaculum sp.]
MTHGPDSDILIAGGGLSGLPLALACAQGGLSVTVVDALDPATATDAKFDGRVSAIALASCRMLEQLGVTQHLEGQMQPINDIMVTDGRVREGASPFFLHFDHREIGNEPLGNLIENRHIRIALQKAVAAEPLIRLLAPQSVTRLDYGAQAVATLGNGETVSARLCFAADGRNSPAREAAGIKTIGWDYGQTGIVSTVEHELPHEGVAQEYFLPGGPFAILPMVGNRSSLVWTEKTEDAKAILALDDAAFADEMRARFGDYLGACAPVGPRWSYPLTLQLARDYIRPRLALIGDAAHGIHPIAGQGLNLGLRDVAAAAEVVVDAARLGLDIGALDVLERYQRWRRFDNVALSLLMDGLNRLFSNDIGPVRLARDLGLGVVSRIGPARRFFMRHAGGVVGDLPRLLRGEAV